MMYHQITFGCKKISSSTDMVQKGHICYMSPHSDPELEDGKPITIPSLVTEGSAAEEMSFRWTFTGILNLFCDLDLNYDRAIQSFHKTIHLMMMCHQTKFTYKRISSSCNILKRQILMILFLTVTLTLKTANQSFWKTIWVILMHHHTKFGSKMFSDLENIIWTNIHWHFEILLWPWPWTQWSNFSTKLSSLW